MYDTYVVTSCPKCNRNAIVINSIYDVDKEKECRRCKAIHSIYEWSLGHRCKTCGEIEGGYYECDVCKMAYKWEHIRYGFNWDIRYCVECWEDWAQSIIGYQPEGNTDELSLEYQNYKVRKFIAKTEVKGCSCYSNKKALVKKEKSDGTYGIYVFCFSCNKHSKLISPKTILSAGINADLIIKIKYGDEKNICCVNGCDNFDTQAHHFAPRELFDDCEKWPIAYLCHEHHHMWHRLTKTGSYK